MKPPLALISIALHACLALLIGPASAQLTLNLTQTAHNGVDIENLQRTFTLMSASDVAVVDDNTAVFSKDYDLISLNSSQSKAGCKSKNLINLTEDPAFKPLYQKRNYLYKQKNPCSVNFATYSMVIAYPIFNIVTTRPETPADLFDIERFPGIRALPDSPVGTLEWALLAYDIPFNEVYQLLSTERGLKLAFAKLDSIKRHIHWWRDIDELKMLIKNSQVSMAGGPHNVFFDLQFNQPMEILWNGQLTVEMNLGVNAESTNIPQAKTFIQSLMRDSAQFKLAYEYAFGPVNKKTLRTLALLPQASQVLVFVPTYRKNRRQAVWLDYNWHQTLDRIITSRFKNWRQSSQQ